MRKAMVSFVIVALMLTFPIAPVENMTNSYSNLAPTFERPREGLTSLASAGGTGNTIPAVQYMSRVITGEQISILNTYADPSNHSGVIDLSSYLSAGWHVYEVTVDVNSMVAAPEREIIADTNNNTNFQIAELAGTFYSQLVQGFYDQPFDGQLQNYSIYYATDRYVPSVRGNASFAITSNYNTSSIMTTRVNVTPSEGTPIWTTLDGENADLDANAVYWALINGSTCYQDAGPFFYYPTVFWYGQDNIGTFASKWYDPPPNDEWDERTVEALLNYTYTPWNRTSGAALQYSSPESLSLLADSLAQTGLSWTFMDGVSNITSIQLDTNQSIYLNYDITIWYRESPSTATNWDVSTSGNPIIWNATTVLIYPVFPETTANFLDITVPSDWATIGLFNSTNPGTNYTHYSKAGDVVTCTDLADETWILSSSAHNYVTAVDLSDSLDSSPVVGKVSILVDIHINATVEDELSNPMNEGTANLTILQSGSTVYSPAEKPTTGGLSHFPWDINSTTTGNGTHSVEVFWTNGTEAGYSVVDVFVYYATSVVADDLSIEAFTKNTFDIGINFDQIFPVRGLDGSLAAVNYDFGSGNTSLIDDGGGRWSATVSTASMEYGTYNLYIYVEGYALENQSLTISVNLIHETQPLNWSWSNTNDIAYLDSTNLSVTYRMLNDTRIEGATVNVTFQGTTYDMAWDVLTETYWIELHGSNFTGVPGNFTLIVNAWKAGHESQYNDTNWIYIQSATGEVFSAEYSPSLDILYIETMTISVSYNFSSSPILGATVNVTINGTDLRYLVYNPVSMEWEITLKGWNITVGTWSINVTASMDGYTTRYDLQTFYVRADTPILGSSWAGNVETTDYVTIVPLTISLTYSNGTPITDAIVSFTAFSTFYPSPSGPGGLYTFDVNPNNTSGVESFTVFVVGIGILSDQIELNLTVEATTSLNFRNLISSEYEEWNLTIEVRYTDSVHGDSILDALVIVTLDGVDYTLIYSVDVYTIEITLDIDPGVYTIYVSASAEFAVDGANQAGITVRPKDVVNLAVTFDGDLVAGQFMEVLATLTDNATNTPISGETIRFEITVFFDNGTVAVYNAGTLTDTTNTVGVASVGFEVPFGNVDRLTARAIFDGTRTKWSTEVTEEASVTVSPLSLLLAFFMSDIGILMIISIALVGIVAAGYNKAVKPKKKATKAGLENQLQMFRDLETVQHFMAVYLDRGTCVFYHPFAEDRIQPDLISGFIAAITSVYGEIKGDGVRGTLEEIQYHGLRLNSYSGQYIIGILILGGEMTTLLRERLQFFVELFENQYDHDLDGWTGVVDCFDPEWVVSTLNSAFNYSWHLPHRFGPTQKVSKEDAKILDYIGAVRDDRSEFYIKNLLAPLAEMLDKTEPEVLDKLLLLEDKGIIVPIGIQTILQRQGLALVDSADELPGPVDSEPVEELEYELEEEVEPEPTEEPPAKPEEGAEIDPMEAFVQDVESILEKEAEKDDSQDSED